MRSHLDPLSSDDGRIELNPSIEQVKDLEITEINSNYIDPHDLQYDEDLSDYSETCSIADDDSRAAYEEDYPLNVMEELQARGGSLSEEVGNDGDISSSLSIDLNSSSDEEEINLDGIESQEDLRLASANGSPMRTNSGGKGNGDRGSGSGSGSGFNDIRGRPSACVFVASLSSSLSDDVLCQSVTTHFKQWGSISLVKVLRDPANRPYAFVQYTNDSDANRAIAEGQHSILNGRTVRCEKARVNRTLYIELSNNGLTQSSIKQLLAKYGEVERIVAVDQEFNNIDASNSPITHTRWFCKYVFRQDAISAFANLKIKPYWTIEWAQNLEDEYNGVPEVTIDRYSIFIGHLDPRISKDELIERFEMHGKIKEAILVNRPLNNFAFIKFQTKEAAASAVERENHSMFKFKTIHVQYRELYNNYKRKFSDSNKNQKLNLAPPPVNFKRRHSHNNDKSNNNTRQQQSQLQPSQTQNFGFGFGNFPIPEKPQMVANSPGAPAQHKQSSAVAHSKHFGIPTRRSGYSRTGSKDSSGSKSFPFKRSGTSKSSETNKPSTSANDKNFDNDTATVHSGHTGYSSAAPPRTMYTYSSVDPNDAPQFDSKQPGGAQNYYQSQVPYYYIVPTKDMGYSASQIAPSSMQDMPPGIMAGQPGMMGGQPGMMGGQPGGYPPLSQQGYYFSYPNAASGVPSLYPFYMYYNPNSVPRSHDERTAGFQQP